MVFQPIVDSSTGVMISAEALIRWMHPSRGELQPMEFVPIIDAMGLSGQLNIYVVDHLISLLKKYDFGLNFPVSANISANVLNFGDNVKHLVSLLQVSQSERSSMVSFEITETSLMSKSIDFTKGSEIDCLLESYSIGLLLDDFGVEYSSINRLFECNFSTIKIDKSFVTKLGTQVEKSAIVIIKAVVDIAAGLGIGVIAEGAETKEQVQILQHIGCQVIQGNIFHQPLSVEQQAALVDG